MSLSIKKSQFKSSIELDKNHLWELIFYYKKYLWIFYTHFSIYLNYYGVTKQRNGVNGDPVSASRGLSIALNVVMYFSI